MPIRSVVATLLAIAACVFTAHTAAAEQKPLPVAGAGQSTDAFIAEQMAEAGIMGLGAAIIVDGKVVWTKGYGWADKQRAAPFTPDTVMNIGSISKTVTGAAMMRAVQDGKLALDADINTYLPFKISNPHYPNEKITLRQLATHTAGVTDRWSVYQDTYHYGSSAPEPLADFLQAYFTPGGGHFATDNFLNHKPGSHREYSNIGAGLVGYIVERAVGEPLNVYSKRVLFTPLQMRNSGWLLSEIHPQQHATLYVAQNGLTIPIAQYQLTTYPDGGVRTSVADLAKLFIALLNDGVYADTRILDKSTVAEMLRFQYTETSKPANVDLTETNSGLFWATKQNVKLIGHSGSDPGLKTEMLAKLGKDVGVILFSNTSLSGDAMRHYLAIYRELWQRAEALKAGTAK